jgi:hypothetical protein
MQTAVLAQSVNARHDRIVGLWDTQVSVLNCNTGVPIANFRGLTKYELGGTAQIVPSTNPTALSAHVGIWSYVQENSYQLAFKMFRFDTAGNNIGWQIVRFDVAINEDATEEAASGRAEIFDSSGNKVGMSCPTLTGTRFQ